jgi:hypothetical protein
MIGNGLVACVDKHDWVEDDGFKQMEFDAHYCCVCGMFRDKVEVEAA